MVRLVTPDPIGVMAMTEEGALRRIRAMRSPAREALVSSVRGYEGSVVTLVMRACTTSTTRRDRLTTGGQMAPPLTDGAPTRKSAGGTENLGRLRKLATEA